MKLKNSYLHFTAPAILGVILILLSSCKTNPPSAPLGPTLEFGKIYVTANVDGAKIFLDDINTGQVTPDTIETEIGTYELRLEKENYLSSVQMVTVLKDSIIQVSFSLEESFSKISVTSNISGARIFLDGINTGKITPDTVSTDPGVHMVSLERAFYLTATKEIEAIMDSVVSLNFVLEEEIPSNVILLEDFANVSCIPCVISDAIVESLTRVTYGYSKLVAIKYPTNFPSPIDPMYLANSEACDLRMSYYNIFAAPTTIIDGTERPISTDSLSVMAAIDQQLLKDTRFQIHVYDEIIGSTYYTTVTVKVIDGAGIDFSNLVLHAVVTETDIEFSTPPGANGLTEFYDVMRVMLPTNTGESLNGISQTEEVVYQWQTNINPIWNVNKLNTVAFIQNVSTKVVYQAGSTFD
jgi:hypothetical protein